MWSNSFNTQVLNYVFVLLLLLLKEILIVQVYENKLLHPSKTLLM